MRFNNLNCAVSSLTVAVTGEWPMAKFDPVAHPLCKIYIGIPNICVLTFLFLTPQYSIALQLGTHRNIGWCDIGSSTLCVASIAVVSHSNNQSIHKLQFLIHNLRIVTMLPHTLLYYCQCLSYAPKCMNSSLQQKLIEIDEKHTGIIRWIETE